MANLSLRFKNYATKKNVEYNGLNFLIWFERRRENLLVYGGLDEGDNKTIIVESQIKDKKLLEDIYKEMDRHGIYKTIKNGDKIGWYWEDTRNDYASGYITGLYVIDILYSEYYTWEDKKRVLSKLTSKDANLLRLKEVVDDIEASILRGNSPF